MIFDTIYGFFEELLGEQIATAQGGIFATYGTYLIIGLGIFALFRLLGGVLKLFKV